MKRCPLSRYRLGVVVLGLIALHAAVLWRLVDLQILRADEMQQIVQRQHERVLELDPIRGDIYDRNGKELALSRDVYSIYANPSQVKSANRTARQLARLLQVNEAKLRKRLKKDGYFVWIKRKISESEKTEIEKLQLPGVKFIEESQRAYPNGELASHVLGYVGIDNAGLAGIEYSHDNVIRGEPGLVRTYQNGYGEGIRTRTEKRPTGGAALVLTIDRVLQHLAERELVAAVKKSHAKSGSVVILNPANGAVLAMANVPTYDPNRFQRYSQSSWRNRAVADAFEPGSTFKMFVAATALEERVARPTDLIDCQNGAVRVGRRKVRDHKPFGELTFSQVLELSSNVGIIKISSRLDAPRLFESLAAFGFGARTGVGLPGENSGILRSPAAWSALSQAMISMGQEVSVTPLQLAAATATLANGGVYHHPYIVQRVIGRDGRVLRVAKGSPGRRVISPATAETLQRILSGVVLRGTGRLASVPGYTVAGKTGTAQKIDSTGRYSPDDFVASFVGWVPLESPALTILVVIDSPRGNYHGGAIAAPVFSRIAQPALQYLRVQPSLLARRAASAPPIVAEASTASERARFADRSR
ncbi:MAG: penicillin-binding protein 2 [Acidobacteria bacterium]|nr:penicillin-binding protein 2 [Acidobacteriota bacterium]